MREREAKLLVPDDVRVPDPGERFADLGDWSTDAIVLDATYFDTADLRLAREGVTIRWRDDGGWTVKTPVGRTAATLDRTEHEYAGEPGSPPAPAVELVLGWTRGAPLIEVARITTRRRRSRLHDGAEVILEIGDDEVSTTSTLAPATTFHEVEVELLQRHADERLQTIVDGLRAAKLRLGTPRPKLVRALGPAATSPPELVDAPDLSTKATLGDLLRSQLVRSTRALVDHDHLVRLGDPAGVHQARVAARRLRADLRLFRHLLPRLTVDRVRDELHWLTALLGFVRDDDVMLDRLREQADAVDSTLPASIVQQLETERAEHRARLLNAMTSPRYLALIDELVVLATEPPLENRRARKRAAPKVRVLVRKPWKKLRAAVRELPTPPTDADLHMIRRRAKRVRYAFESTTPVLGAAGEKVERRANLLQDLLGHQHDAVVTAQWLANASSNAPAEDAFIAVELAETFVSLAGESGDRWRPRWKKLRAAYRRL